GEVEMQRTRHGAQLKRRHSRKWSMTSRHPGQTSLNTMRTRADSRTSTHMGGASQLLGEYRPRLMTRMHTRAVLNGPKLLPPFGHETALREDIDEDGKEGTT